ncbi:molecular chaperone GrpE [Robertmurraya kyonggiensis]|uniref:Molecular chaperone GrpE n=1 Tax=Robertmurraya kyonggiensis TaxID=1037680 RepID=A0A4U1CXB3_9BACI|nr:molecular chaperone GrpE [Robertmurraya kyonggiensis]TKC13848.1 molecular chaperone GrpE [Robertmurraya kyonggiensis]
MKGLYQKRAKLVGSVDRGMLWLINMHDDWIHDQYGESYIYHGIIYSSTDSFHELSTSVTGYFQDDDTQKWIEVKDGKAIFDSENINQTWKERLESFIKVTIQTGRYHRYIGNLRSSL